MEIILAAARSLLYATGFFTVSLYLAFSIRNLDGPAVSIVKHTIPCGLATRLVLADAFDAALTEAYDKKAPNALAEHAYRLAQAFSKFYAACPILQAGPATRASRLTLATATLRQLELALDLLGISVPERM